MNIARRSATLVATVLALTRMASFPSCRLIFFVVLRVHLRPLMGSPAVSCSMSCWMVAITPGVFFP